MPRPSREQVLEALFATLVGSLETSFTANTAAGNPVLSNVSTTQGLYLGVPVVGGSIPPGSVVQSLAPLTLTIAPTANATAVALETGFLTTDRRLAHYSKVQEQPALFQVSATERTAYQGLQQRRTIRADVFVYTNVGKNPNIVPEKALHALLDAIEAAMAPDNPGTGQFTLGGLVSWCRVAAEDIDKIPGNSTNPQAAAVLPIEILVP